MPDHPEGLEEAEEALARFEFDRLERVERRTGIKRVRPEKNFILRLDLRAGERLLNFHAVKMHGPFLKTRREERANEKRVTEDWFWEAYITVKAAAPALRKQERQRVEVDLDLDQLRSELHRLAEGRMTLDSTELLTWAEGWLLTLHGTERQERGSLDSLENSDG